MTLHHIETGQNPVGEHTWKIVKQDTDEVVAYSAEAYKDKREMLKSLFSIFFGDYDDSFLALYAEWNPDNSGHAWQEAPRAASEGMDEIPAPTLDIEV